MCKLIGKYLCCCCCFDYFKTDINSSGKEKQIERNKRTAEKDLMADKKSSDSERYLKSSSETDFDRFESKTDGSKKFKKIPKVEIRFISPKNAVDNTLASHRIRLLERGFDLQSDKPIGQGAFSQVYTVLRISDKTLMACKIKMNKELAESTRLIRELREEIQFVNTEPMIIHLVRYFGQFIYDSKYSYIVMELSNGESLHNRLAKSAQPYTESETKSFFMPIARAVNYLHSQRIAHRNLKLDNVLIFKDPNGNEILKVSDYCANRMASKAAKVVVYMRDAKSITYMSPQILKFYAKHLHKSYKKSERKIKAFDAFKGDIWALGVCLYYMLMKTAPYGIPPDTTNLDDKTAVKQKFKFLEQCLAKFDNRLDLAEKVNLKISRDCVRLLEDLLEPKGSRRIEHYGVITHSWVIGNLGDSQDGKHTLQTNS